MNKIIILFLICFNLACVGNSDRIFAQNIAHNIQMSIDGTQVYFTFDICNGDTNNITVANYKYEVDTSLTNGQQQNAIKVLCVQVNLLSSLEGSIVQLGDSWTLTAQTINFDTNKLIIHLLIKNSSQQIIYEYDKEIINHVSYSISALRTICKEEAIPIKNAYKYIEDHQQFIGITISDE